MATDTVPNLEVRVYQPSAPLMTLVENVKRVARFDVGIIQVFEQATKIAAVNQLMGMPEMDAILDKLEGSPAGFQTDIFKDGKYYPKKERNMALTQGLALGARLCNKEIAIIRGNAFLGKNYYQRMLDELGHDGSFTEKCKYRMMWWDTEIGEIRLNGAIATAETKVTYKIVDKATGEELTPKPFIRTFQIKTNGTDTPDLWVGKFERRCWQKLLRYLSGVDFGDDGDEGGGSGQGQAPTAPPVGNMSLAKEAPAKTEAPQPAVSDATFTEIVKPTAAPTVAAAPTEATSKTQTKPYAEMSAEEKKVETARAHAESQKATAAPAATASAPEAPTAPTQAATPAAGAKPELF